MENTANSITLPASALQTVPHASMSKNYDFISTAHVVGLLQDHGYTPIKAVQTKVRKQDKDGYQKHMVVFQNKDLTVPGLGDIRLALRNSHEGSSSFQLIAAMHVMICSNGLFRHSGDLSEIRVLHKGFQESKFEQAILQFNENLPVMQSEIESFRLKVLSPTERLSFAQTAIEMKYGPDNKYEINPDAFLRCRRTADRVDTLWGCYQVVQENIIKGGPRIRVPIDEAAPRTRRAYNAAYHGIRSRAVGGIDANVKLNKGLWQLAASYL